MLCGIQYIQQIANDIGNIDYNCYDCTVHSCKVIKLCTQ